MSGIVLFGFILLKKVTKPGLVEHELVHWRQGLGNRFRFFFRYAFSRRWRVIYEAEAYAVQVRTGEETIEWCAKTLSGPLYLWPCSYATALEAIRSRV
jgi:hypothetical protein